MIGVPFEFSKFLSCLSLIHCSAEQQSILHQLRYSGGKYSDFADLLLKLPESRNNLINAANEMFESRLREKISDPAVALSMIGFVPARNYLAASIIHRHTPGQPKLLPGDPLVNKTLQFALFTEKQMEDLASDYFLGGFVYDLLTTRFFAPSDSYALQLTQSIITHGLSMAKAAMTLAKTLVPHLHLEKELCLDGLLHDIGRLTFLYLSPETETQLRYDPLLAESKTQKEASLYPISHSTAGYFVLSKLGSGGTLLQDSRWVTLYHHQPFMAWRQGPQIHARTMVLWLADHVLRYKEHYETNDIPERLAANWLECCRPIFQKSSEPTPEDFKKLILSITA